MLAQTVVLRHIQHMQIIIATLATRILAKTTLAQGLALTVIISALQTMSAVMVACQAVMQAILKLLLQSSSSILTLAVLTATSISACGQRIIWETL